MNVWIASLGWFLAVVGWLLAILLGRIAMKFGRTILTFEEQTELTLDVLDVQYGRLNDVLAVPLAVDDMHARTAVDAIRTAHDSVLSVANVLVGQSPGAKKEMNDDDEQ